MQKQRLATLERIDEVVNVAGRPQSLLRLFISRAYSMSEGRAIEIRSTEDPARELLPDGYWCITSRHLGGDMASTGVKKELLRVQVQGSW